VGELAEILGRLEAIEKAINWLARLVLEELYGEEEEDSGLLAMRLQELQGHQLFKNIYLLGDPQDDEDDDEPEIRPV